ncbi:protein peste-like [Lucilia sericata]|uniref:protein peste-like n=1 Tax=Lucilia sericata TaxID=13632 RepID=UPI0018A827B6|nr:protein peste-like [Lucilia sericata]
MPQKSKGIKLWTPNSRRILISILGFILGIGGILCGMFWEQIFNSILAKQMVLRPDSEVYDKWKTPPIPLSLDIYLYNWTNPEDFKNFSTKPILEQCGPYRFTEKPDKVDINWHPENASVTYRKKSLFYFDAAGSKGSLDDEITTLNAVALSAASKAKQWNTVRRRMVDMGLKLYGQEMSVTKTVDELLFTGYSDDMIDMARSVPIFGNDVEVPFDKFGWFYTRNGSADLTGVFNVFTGANDWSQLGQLHNWNYQKHTGFFDSYCGLVNGSAGEFQPPNLTPHNIVQLFTPDMCRTIPLDYTDTQEIEGIKGYKYSGGLRSLDNGTLYPENSCFCGGQCVPSGVMNVSSCRFGSPVFMSYPHFYKADPFYLDQVEGLDPKHKDHEFYMILEPKTGIALEVAARFQVNMLVEPIPSLSLYENIPRIFFPLIWFEQKVRITPELAKDLKMIPCALLGGQIFAGIIFAIGLILLGWYPLKQLCCLGKNKKMKINHLENDSCKSNELRPLQTKKFPAKPHTPTLDGSPLLEKPAKIPTIVSNSNTDDSLNTTSTALSDKTN